ncbi:MAG: hypothetical protein V4649_16060 [Bacteroidota bacterium]
MARISIFTCVVLALSTVTVYGQDNRVGSSNSNAAMASSSSRDAGGYGGGGGSSIEGSSQPRYESAGVGGNVYGGGGGAQDNYGPAHRTFAGYDDMRYERAERTEKAERAGSAPNSYARTGPLVLTNAAGPTGVAYMRDKTRTRSSFPDSAGKRFTGEGPLIPISCREYYILYNMYPPPLVDRIVDETPGRTVEEIPALPFNNAWGGYMIYKGDKLEGNVILTRSAVLVKGSDGNVQGAKTDDLNVEEIAFFKKSEQLVIKRHAEDKSQLWRVIHSGKLGVYDDKYEFVAFDNINTDHLRITYNGTFADISSKEQLVAAINAAYGRDIQAGDYSWAQLLGLLDTLD